MNLISAITIFKKKTHSTYQKETDTTQKALHQYFNYENLMTFFTLVLRVLRTAFGFIFSKLV